jgi:hypothetical protein
MSKYSPCTRYYLPLNPKYSPHRNVTSSLLCPNILLAPVTIHLLIPNILSSHCYFLSLMSKYSPYTCYYLPLHSKHSPQRIVTSSPLRQNILLAPVTIYLFTPKILLIVLLRPLPYVKIFSLHLLLSTSSLQIFSSSHCYVLSLMSKYSPCTCYYLPLNSKYSPHRIITFSPLCPNILLAPVISHRLHPKILRHCPLILLPQTKAILDCWRV